MLIYDADPMAANTARSDRCVFGVRDAALHGVINDLESYLIGRSRIIDTLHYSAMSTALAASSAAAATVIVAQVDSSRRLPARAHFTATLGDVGILRL